MTYGTLNLTQSIIGVFGTSLGLAMMDVCIQLTANVQHCILWVRGSVDGIAAGERTECVPLRAPPASLSSGNGLERCSPWRRS